MGYTVGSKKVIKDDNTTQLNTLTVSTTDYLEIGEIIPDVIGTVSSFSSGGTKPPPSPTSITTIDKFPFAISSGTATDVGDLPANRFSASGNNSDADAFVVAGSFPPPSGGTSGGSQIDKFPFAISGGTSTDVGDITQNLYYQGPAQSLSQAYTVGGQNPGTPSPARTAQIDKFPFAISGGTSTNVGNISIGRAGLGGHSSLSEGFTSGGTMPTSSVGNVIDKFPFAIDAGTGTDVGDLSRNATLLGYNSSTSDGFNSGGLGDTTGVIDKFPFAITSGTATNVGSLSARRQYISNGTQTSSNGFLAGGEQPTPPLPGTVIIDKFPFAISSGSATNVGSLTSQRAHSSGAQD